MAKTLSLTKLAAILGLSTLLAAPLALAETDRHRDREHRFERGDRDHSRHRGERRDRADRRDRGERRERRDRRDHEYRHRDHSRDYSHRHHDRHYRDRHRDHRDRHYDRKRYRDFAHHDRHRAWRDRHDYRHIWRDRNYNRYNRHYRHYDHYKRYNRNRHYGWHNQYRHRGYYSPPRVIYKHRYHNPRYAIGSYYHTHRGTIIIRDYDRYGLYHPPHGYHWVHDRDHGDAILRSVATGAIIGLVIGALHH